MQMIYALYYNSPFEGDPQNRVMGMFATKELARKYRNQLIKSECLDKEDFEIQWYYLNKA